MQATIVCLPGDGIGPEVISAATQVLTTIERRFGHQFNFIDHLIGGASIEATGQALTDEVLKACQKADAVLLGAVGGPKWDDPAAQVRPEQGLLAIRKGLDVFANLRPVRTYARLLDASPLKTERLQGVDLVVVRELSSGLYYGKPRMRETVGSRIRVVDTLEYFDDEIERLVRVAFELAQKRRQKLTSVDKANVLESSRLWRQVVQRVAEDFPDVTVEHVLVDTAAMRLISSPAIFDVIVTENMFGDILTDEASVISGSMGLLPSASLGNDGPGIYEPIHGSAPDIAGKGIANPVGTILSAAMMLRHSLRLETEAKTIESVVDTIIEEGIWSADLGGTNSTKDITNEIINRISV